LIVECGTWAGGSALFLAHMLDIIGSGAIITIDVLDADEIREHYIRHLPELAPTLHIRPQHPRIKQLIGSSTASGIVAQVMAEAPETGAVMLIADSDHSLDHAYSELKTYHRLVTPGSYFVMEDTNIPQDGPRQAVERFLSEQSEFEIDPQQEKFLLTFNPSGYLLRK